VPPLFNARDISKSYAAKTLFEGVSLSLADDERLGFIGPNGAGKSTLLKIIAGLETTDDGDLTRRRGAKLVYVPQDDQFGDGATVLSSAVDALTTGDDTDRGLDPQTQASIMLSRLGFIDHEQPVATLSGGWRKRLAIARALAHEPDALLLDEPTNHLDLEGIVWLEQFVQRAAMAVVFITHDRRFLENTARRIIELSAAYPGGTFQVMGNYSEFVRRKEAFLEAQAGEQSEIANRVRRDTAWLRQGIQGRQTRNKTQVADAAARRAELAAVTERNAAPTRTTSIDFQATARKTKKLLALHAISKSMGGRTLFSSLDLTLAPGQRIGLVGPNGAGKTTLLRILAGELEPDAGTRKPAVDLRLITFSQHRTLDTSLTLQEALCPVGDTVDYRGKPMHVTGWARKFLFATDQLSTFVSNLSGGERARVLIARLMLEPADVLLLDEPTNDLDIPSLEVLEQALMEFPGAIVLVTHDRFMLERVSTEFLAFDSAAGARTFASYDQCIAAQRERAPAPKKATQAAPAPKVASPAKPKKLSYKHQREADGMEEAILTAEAEVERLEAIVGDPAVIADHKRHHEACAELETAHAKVHALYERWAELEAMVHADG
jgi:ATP-binding cassette subfamily F protein uup